MQTFDRKNIVLTGAATGIGRLMALMMAEEGKPNLALLDINRDKLNETAAQAAAKGADVRGYPCDISQKEDIERVVESIRRDLGHVDLLINNAGIVTGKYIEDLTYEDLKRTLEVNFLGGAYLTKLLLPDMIARKAGHIVNIASAMGLTGVPRMADYVASKFAIVGFTDTLRMELKKRKITGIKTLCVCPSGIDTGMFPGYKAPLMSPLLKPETVARKTLQAIKTGQTYLKIPLIVKFIPSMKLFPAPVQDILGELTGTSRSMDHFAGKGPERPAPQAHTWRGDERRRQTRGKVDIPCDVKGVSRGTRIRDTVRVIDLSRTGMYVETATPLDEGTQMQASINAIQYGSMFGVQGTVLRSTATGMAIRFAEEIEAETILGAEPR